MLLVLGVALTEVEEGTGEADVDVFLSAAGRIPTSCRARGGARVDGVEDLEEAVSSSVVACSGSDIQESSGDGFGKG